MGADKNEDQARGISSRKKKGRGSKDNGFREVRLSEVQVQFVFDTRFEISAYSDTVAQMLDVGLGVALRYNDFDGSYQAAVYDLEVPFAKRITWIIRGDSVEMVMWTMYAWVKDGIDHLEWAR